MSFKVKRLEFCGIEEEICGSGATFFLFHFGWKVHDSRVCALFKQTIE